MSKVTTKRPDPNTALQAIIGAAERAATMANRSFGESVPSEPTAAAIALGSMLVGSIALCGAGLCMMAYGVITRGAPIE